MLDFGHWSVRDYVPFRHQIFGSNCAQRTPDGMVNVKSRKCKTQGCVKASSFGVAGTKTAEYCEQYAPDEMVDIKSRKCRTQGCGKGPSFGVAGTTTAEYCAQRAKLQFGVEKYRDREVGLFGRTFQM